MIQTNLLYKDSTTEGKGFYFSQSDIRKDFSLTILLKTMAKDNPFILEKIRKVLMIPLNTAEEIIYRQEIVSDFYQNFDLITFFFDIASRQYMKLTQYKEDMDKNRAKATRKTGEILDTLNFLSQSIQALNQILEHLNINADKLHSEGLILLRKNLQEEPLEELLQKLEDINFYVDGGEISYALQFGGGMKIKEANISYCKSQKRKKAKKQNKFQGLYYKYVKKDTILIDSESMKQDINQILEVTLSRILELFEPYRHSIMLFFEHFAEEISFYMGTCHLMARMEQLEIPLHMPVPCTKSDSQCEFNDLYELTMAIYMQTKPVGNDGVLKHKKLLLITGANQGGKSTFLRSYGIAQLLMQCGMPVPAKSFCAPIYRQLFTHFTRREDETLSSGRLQEELKRMNEMIRIASADSLFLLNESFASTTEKEGSRIASGIIHAFYEKNITTWMVTHLFEFAKNMYEEKLDDACFLVAQRQEDGTRTYKMQLGKPEYTSYGTDLFQIIEKE